MVCLMSYCPACGVTYLLDSTTIWQACRATSAATTFFDLIAIGPFQEQFVDGGLGANNPVYALWTQAQDVWGDDRLQASLRCLVLIGTGVPPLRSVHNNVLGIGATLIELATETERTAEQFHRNKSGLDDKGRYYRFNVSYGLKGVGLEESKKQREIAAMTGRYIASQDVFRQIKAYASSLARKQYFSSFKTPFSLDSAPTSNNFVARPSNTADLEKCLLPSRLRSQQTRRLFDTFSSVFWLDSRSEDRLKQSIAGCIAKIPEGQVPGASRRWAEAYSQDELDAAVASIVE
ncbi:hypothetical protein FOCG_11898 [Fusarium oxysporum f. sp. radicis-lycopersici 26381]|nr:hypothetical protein FOCG_11898 [Fusarium oxysporum f. sp. radicis-lycopersici 26381]